MANVMDGIEKPGVGEEVNTQAGFEAIMAGKGVEPDTAPGEERSTSDTSIASGLTTHEPGSQQQPRDADTGKFAARTEEPAKPDTSTDEGQQVVSDDPEVAALLAKYGGDPAKALKAAAEAQQLLGRQGTELGQMREQIAELRGMVAAGLQRPAEPALSDDQVEERASGMIQSKGWTDAATEAANLAHTTGDERLYRTIFEQWNLEDPYSAQTHIADFRAWQREQRQAPAAVADPWVEEQKTQTGIEATFTQLQNELGKESFDAIAPKMLEALESMPKNVVEMVASSDPEARLEGARLVADRAARMTGASTVEGTPAEGGMPAAVARKLSGASVATGALRPAPEQQSGETSVEDAIKAFKQGILAAETTTVASGLTFGKQ